MVQIMASTLLPFGIELTPLRKITHPKGDIFHAMKASDRGFKTFGEAYFTTINNNETKGWKLHNKMEMNLVVVLGEVDFHFCDDESSEVYTVRLGQSNYGRLTIPAGIWMAFSGRGKGLNLILNIASIEHDPQEAINVPLDRFSIGS